MIDFLIYAGWFWMSGAAICGGAYLLMLGVEAIIDNIFSRSKSRGKY